MKEKKRLDSLYSFEDEEVVEEAVNIEGTGEEGEDGAVGNTVTEMRTKPSEQRTLTYKIEDSTAEMMNYNAIIETSKKTLKSAKKEYEKVKKEYDSKSFGALVYDILTFAGAFFSVYFLVKWLTDKSVKRFEILLYVSLTATVFFLLFALYKNFKLRPLKKKLKRAKELIRDSKTWIEASERGIENTEQEIRELKRQRNNL